MSSKRSNAFQGRPEQPYDDRDEPADPPKRASAAQLAARKIKSAKGSRRPAGASSGISAQPASFGFGGGDANASSTASSFGFGSPQPQPQSAQNGSAFGASFGGSATNSFPPTQTSNASTNFSSSSFPAFGGNGTNTSFNPTPPSASFNFTAGASNPFAASAPAPAMNGSTNGAANGSGSASGSGFGSSIFNSAPSQPQGNNLFGGFGQQSSTSSAAPSGSVFGTSSATSSAPATNVFGTSTSTSSAPSGNMFGTSTSTSAASSGSMFGTTSTAATPAPATSMFGSAPAATTPAAPANPFAKLAAAPSSTPSAGLFNFGASQPAPASTQESTPKPASTLFSASTSAAPLSTGSSAPGAPFSLFGAKTQDSTSKTQETSSTPAPASTSVFGSQPAGDAPSTPAPSGLFQFGGQSSTPAPSTSVFKGFNSTSQGESASASAPAPAPSNSLFQFSTSGSASKPAASPSLFSSTTPAAKPDNPYKGILTGGLARTQDETSGSSAPAESTPVKTNMFSFGTPQTAPAKTTKETEETPKIGLGKTTFSSTPQTGSGLFAQSTEKTSESSPFQFSSSTQPANTQSTPSLFSQSQPAASKSDDAHKTPFSFTPQKPAPQPAQSSTPNFFGASSKQQEPSSSMPTLTGAAAPPPEASRNGPVPSISRFNVPGNWGNGKATGTDVQGLTIQLVELNNNYRQKLAALPASADWSQLSKWHARSTDDIMQKIAAFKKQKAAAKGITGNESSLSVKRKADADNSNERSYDSPSKRSRAVEPPATPAAKSSSLFSTTPKATPPPSETSSLFGSVLNKSTSEKEAEPAKSTQSGFSFSTSTTPATKPASQSLFGNTATAPSSKSAASQSLFANTSSTPGSKPEGSKSLFQMPSSSTPSAKPAGSQSLFGGSLLSQFSSKAKSYDELVAERKKKDKDDDYDSDDETYEEWSARWDKKEAERVAKLKEDEKEKPTVKVSAPSSASSAGPGLLSGGFKFGGSTSGASTPGLLGSRVGSPAPSNGAQSVFDTDEAQSPASNNIFGHLSAGPSSNQDEDEDDEEDAEGEDDSVVQSAAEQSKPKRNPFQQSESESEESLEETMRNKKQATNKPSLADRITKDSSSKGTDESEKENGDPSKTSIFGQPTNGVQTPTNKPFTFFDFDGAAGSKTVPPKEKSAAVDQTFKAGTPIKFGTAVKSNPTFQFMPATPGPAEFSATPSKPPAASTFSFLASASTPGSVLSSRAPTPLSETEVSAADNEDEEGEGQNQLDLSGLTEEEKAENDILFHVDPALCKHQSSGPEGHKWENYARGPLWILKNKQSGKAFVRMRLHSGATMLNYNILPKLKSTLSGKSDVKKMVSAIGTKKDGKTGNLCFAVKTPELAAEFSKIYNENLPS